MLDTIDSVIEAVGGPSAVTRLTGVGSSGQSNWKARGAIPSDLFLIFEKALRAKGKSADRSVFGFKAAVGAK
jgi:hypothetical protein